MSEKKVDGNGTFYYEIIATSMPPNSKYILLFIASHFRGNFNSWINMPIKQCGKYLNLSRFCSKQGLHWLCDNGYLESKSLAGYSNAYRLTDKVFKEYQKKMQGIKTHLSHPNIISECADMVNQDAFHPHFISHVNVTQH